MTDQQTHTGDDKAAAPTAPRWLRPALGVALLLNVAVLLFVQHYWHGDFPFQDEWGFVARLQQLPQLGVLHFLFDRYHTYYLPVLLSFWYLSYTLTHLDIEALRYTGALVSGGVALLLVGMLYRKAPRLDKPVWLLLLFAPFVVCSLNHYMVYYQSIESVVQPFLFGMVLTAFWAADHALQGRRALPWSALAVGAALIGVGIYAPGLSILPAIVGAQILIQRRLSLSSVLLALLGVLCIGFYVHAGHGLDHPQQGPGFAPGDLVQAVKMWFGLSGNALFSPHAGRLEIITYFLGAVLLAAQAVGLVTALRQPPERRKALFLPVALTLYNNLVILEIVTARLHVVESGLESSFTPRYSILALAGPVSVMFYLVMLGDLRGRLRRLGSAAFLAMALGTLAADAMIAILLPHYAAVLATVRAELLSLQGPPDAFQTSQMTLTPTMKPLVYPGRLYLQQEHLALYRNSESAPPADHK
ncbi:MAG TPA: hypothetical protein VKT74_04905 [Gammaproteobacteria bacterium]|nr:hypothetical protein [Gammaproteobacteria bacterium]